MKRILISLFAVFIGFGLLAPHDAEARRMGGSKSFGMQRTAPAKQNTAPTPQRQQTPASPTAAPKKNSWMGPIAGLAAGLGLAALFSHLGLGEEMANFLMLALLALAAFMLIRYFMRRNAPATPAMQYASAHRHAASPVTMDANAQGSGSSAGAQLSAYPPGFDADAFTREAKLNFIRLQAAFDAGNLDDLRAFTSPEVFAEVSMQLAERGEAAQVTDVMTLNADVIEAVEEGDRHVVSVRFTGLVREAAEQSPVSLDEVWHLTRPADGRGGWVIAGIQQQ